MNRLIVCALVLGCGDDTPKGPTTPPVTVQSNGMAIPADYSCNGHFMTPAAVPNDFTVKVTVTDLQTKAAIPNCTIKVYRDTASALADTPFDTQVTDANGKIAALRIPGGQPYVVVHGSAQGYIDGYIFNAHYGFPDTETTASLPSEATADLVQTVTGINWDRSKGLVGAIVDDCNGASVKGAVGSASVGGVAQPQSNVAYVNDQNVPVRQNLQPYTGAGGGFVALNVAAPGTATISAKGVLTAGTGAVMLGQDTVPIIPGALTAVVLHPL